MQGGGEEGQCWRDRKSKKKDIKSSGRQKDLVAVGWFWQLADKYSSLDAILGRE